MTTHGVGGNVPHATRRTTPFATSQRIGLYFHEHEWTTTTTTATKSPNPPPPPQPVNDPNQKPVVVAGDKTKEETTSRCSHGSPNEDLIGPEQYEDDDSSRVLLVTFDLPVTTTRITTTTTTPWCLCSLNQVTVAVADADTTLTASTTTTSSSYQNTLYSTNTITGSPMNAVQKGKDEHDGNASPPLPPTGTCTWFWNVRVRYNQEEEDDMNNTTTAASPQSRRPWSHANQVNNNNNKNDKNDSCRLHQALKYHPESVTCRMCRMMGVHEEQDDDRPEVLEATESALGESQRLVYEWTNTATSLFASSSSSPSSQTAATTTKTTKRTNDDDDDGQQTAPFSITTTTTTTTHAVDATTRTTTTGFDLYQLPTGHWQDMAEYLSCGGGGGGDEVNSHHFFWPTTASLLHENVQNTNNNNNNNKNDDDDHHHHHHDYRHRIGWNAGYLVVGAAASAALVNPQACFPLLYHDDESSWFAHSTTATTTATTWYPSILSSVSFLTTTWHPLACSRCCSILGFCSLPSTTRNTSSAPFPSSSSSSSLTRVDEDAATDTSLGDADTDTRAGADHGPEKDRSRIDGSFLDGTVYLLRHALSSSSSSATCANPTTAAAAVDCSPLQFWIQELIHLAETKGIFTMVLRKNHHNNNNTTTTNGKDSSSSATTTTTTATVSCLWIRLGHWNSQEASNRVHKNNHKQQQRPNTTTTIESLHQPLKWYRVAKVVYQFLENGNELSSSNDQNQQEEEEAATASSTTEESPLSFPWTRNGNGNHNRSNGNDWCCRPTTEAAATSTTNPSRDTDPVANAPPLALEAVVWNDWEWESMQHDLRQQWNVLFVCEATTSHLTPTTTFSTTQRMAQTTYWAQTGKRLTDVQCTTRSAGVAHVPLDYWG
ncbi:hypothetical protein ACA910_010472 [Epithemia clementina (nom. ined.)]